MIGASFAGVVIAGRVGSDHHFKPLLIAAHTFREIARGIVIVAIHLPTKPHALHPVSNGGVFYCPKPSADRLTSSSPEPVLFSTKAMHWGSPIGL